MTFKQRTKKEKEKTAIWLKTEEGKNWQQNKIAEKNTVNAKNRKKADIALMNELGIEYDCKKCLHGIGRHCLLKLKNGCIDYFERSTLKQHKDFIKNIASKAR